MSYSQDKIYGQIFLEKDSSPVPYVHVINRTNHIGTISDGKGVFQITANDGDEIMFSAIGYKEHRITVNQASFSRKLEIILDEEVYPLSEVKVFRFNNYESFKKEFLRNAPDIDTTFNHILPPLEGYANKRPEWGAGFTISNPITSLYSLLSREGKNYRKLMDIIDGTDRNLLSYQKFNGVVVKNLTGLEGEELIDFLSYCNFSPSYLYQSSQNEVRRAILYKYEQYKLQR